MIDSIADPTVSLQTIIPSYLYQEYADDADLQGFVDAQNELTQSYLEWFNATPLAVYTNPSIAGQLLDWIAAGIYGIMRPVFSSQTTKYIAGLNSLPRNTVAVNGIKFIRSGTAMLADDDYYRRVLTWWLYVGNGRMFYITLLRLKVARFLYGVNGTDITLSQAQTVHIQPGEVPTPGAPVLSSVAGGSLAQTAYFVRYSLVSELGGTLAGPSSVLWVPANQLLKVASPPATNGAISYNVYVTNTPILGAVNNQWVNESAVNENPSRIFIPPTKQTVFPIAIGTDWTEPASGLINGLPLPTENSSNFAGNFIITVPAGASSTLFQQAFEDGLLAFPFQLSASVVIS